MDKGAKRARTRKRLALQGGESYTPPGPENQNRLLFILLVFFFIGILFILFGLEANPLYAASIPGEDATDKLKAAGTLLRVVDTGVFKWGARVFSGLCIMSSGWALKEQRFGVATISVIGAIIFGTAPKWVNNIFEIGDNQGIFSQLETTPEREAVALLRLRTGESARA